LILAEVAAASAGLDTLQRRTNNMEKTAAYLPNQRNRAAPSHYGPLLINQGAQE
jgi:hypothetical protein